MIYCGLRYGPEYSICPLPINKADVFTDIEFRSNSLMKDETIDVVIIFKTSYLTGLFLSAYAHRGII